MEDTSQDFAVALLAHRASENANTAVFYADELERVQAENAELHSKLSAYEDLAFHLKSAIRIINNIS